MKLKLVRTSDKNPVRFKAQGGYILYSREWLARDEVTGHYLKGNGRTPYRAAHRKALANVAEVLSNLPESEVKGFRLIPPLDPSPTSPLETGTEG